MTVALWKGLGMSIAEINSKHNCLSRSSLQQVKFPHALQEKKQPRWPRDKLLRIPICYGRKADQNNKKSNPRMSILTSRQIINVGESWEKGEPPCLVSGNGHWQQLLERTASLCQKKKKKLSRKLSLGYWFPTPEPKSWENHHSKRHTPPMFTAMLLPIANIHSIKHHRQIKS